MTKTAIFRRFPPGRTTNKSEQELADRSGQRVELLGEAFDADPGDGNMMQYIRFADGYESLAFEDELSQTEGEESMLETTLETTTETTNDWNVDGHYIVAPTAREAMDTAARLYQYEPTTVRAWTDEDGARDGDVPDELDEPDERDEVTEQLYLDGDERGLKILMKAHAQIAASAFLRGDREDNRLHARLALKARDAWRDLVDSNSGLQE